MKPAQVEAFHIHVSFETVQVNVIHKAITSCFNRTNPGIGVQPVLPFRVRTGAAHLMLSVAALRRAALCMEF